LVYTNRTSLGPTHFGPKEVRLVLSKHVSILNTKVGPKEVRLV
jgi:hypothetical protein